MTDHPANNGQVRPGESPSQGWPSVRSRLLRAAADAQLTAVGEKALHTHLAHHPEDQAVIAFEQHLRQSIAATASTEPSVELRDRIQRMLGSAQRPREATPFAPQPPSPSPARKPWRQVWPSGRRWLAIAASLAIFAGTAYFAIMQLPQDGLTQRELITPTRRAALVSFVSSEHEECELHADMVGNKLRIDSLDKAPAAFREVLGREPDLGRLAASGLRFKGAGPCAVPGRGSSVHMVFDAGATALPEANGRTPLVSIFIQQDTGELNIEPGRTYRLAPIGDSSDGGSDAAAGVTTDIFVWKADGFIYFLSSTFEPAMQKARLALGAREPSGPL